MQLFVQLVTKNPQLSPRCSPKHQYSMAVSHRRLRVPSFITPITIRIPLTKQINNVMMYESRRSESVSRKRAEQLVVSVPND